MIRIIRARRLAALTDQRDRAEARVPAVQLRLAGVKSDRDQLLRDFDERAVLVQEQAAKLERNLRAEEQRAESLAAQLRQAREELATLRTVERWLQRTVMHYLDVAEAPVEVIVRDGVVYSVQRSREAAHKAVEAVDSSVTGWRPTPPDADLRVGWKVSSHRLPEAARPAHYAELQAHYWPEDTESRQHQEPGQLAEADQAPSRFSALDRSLWLMANHLEEGRCTECPAALGTLSLSDLLGLACMASNYGWEKALDLVDAESKRRAAARGEVVR